jgi:hypothetical protein
MVLRGMRGVLGVGVLAAVIEVSPASIVPW